AGLVSRSSTWPESSGQVAAKETPDPKIKYAHRKQSIGVACCHSGCFPIGNNRKTLRYEEQLT
ncbi:MAG: hypothetical protein LUF04_03790, partial [Bacteroides sp.]|nr:hypothetical protein [Bacteroides sp.]